MRIAFLCKRRYMGKDVILDRYARLYEIPRQLAELGHDVLGQCLAYHDDADGSWEHQSGAGRLRWRSYQRGRLGLLRIARYPGRLLAELRQFRPDVVIGASDIPHAVLARWLARKLAIPYVVDLYDNFESFGQARIPGAKRALRSAVRGAAVVSCTSEPLARLVRERYGAGGIVLAMPSTVDLAVFRHRDRLHCRRSLGLPEQALLIGTAGALFANRGIGTVYQAFAAVDDPRVHLVLAGPVDPKMPPPSGDRVHYLGNLAHERTAELFAALDLGLIYLKDTEFGRFCFPQKAYEMAACRLPFLATDVGAMGEWLRSSPELLYRLDDSRDLARKISSALIAMPTACSVPEDWRALVGRLEQAIGAVLSSRQPSNQDRV